MSNVACKYCQTEREHDYDFAECCDGGHIEALEAKRDELLEQLAKADQHIKLHCSDLASSIIQDSNKA